MSERVTMPALEEAPTSAAQVQQPPPANFGTCRARTVPRRRPAHLTPAAYVTPLVRKLASDHNVDLTSVKGADIGGRIRRQDVLDAIAAAKTEAVPALTAAQPQRAHPRLQPLRPAGTSSSTTAPRTSALPASTAASAKNGRKLSLVPSRVSKSRLPGRAGSHPMSSVVAPSR
jgi:2-oxoglutarate dehydrogenase E2 component (dihydrolipoamide succinyltransferase)